MDYNPLTEILAACECGLSSKIKLFKFVKQQGLTFLSASTAIVGVTDIKNINFSKDAMRICVFLPEPLFILKIYSVDEKYTIRELIDVPLGKEYLNFRISPLNKNIIIAMRPEVISLIEIKDSFPDNYKTLIGEEEIQQVGFGNLKESEENILVKRFTISTLNTPENLDEFTDFTFDMYGNFYASISSGFVNLYDLALNKITVMVQGEPKTSVNLSGSPTCLLLTQKNLMAALDNGKIAIINIYISEKEIASFKQSIGNPENYRMFDVSMELTPSIFSHFIHNTGSINNFEDSDYITLMKYDPDYKKIIFLTKNNTLNFIVLKAEILIKDKEKEEINDNNVLTNEVETYEELKFHSQAIIGIKELGNTTQFITLSNDKKIIFWDIAERATKHVYNLNFNPSAFETDLEGNLLFIGSQRGVLRIYDISLRNQMRLIFQNNFS